VPVECAGVVSGSDEESLDAREGTRHAQEELDLLSLFQPMVKELERPGTRVRIGRVFPAGTVRRSIGARFHDGGRRTDVGRGV
jgi:hypothetical protein